MMVEILFHSDHSKVAKKRFLDYLHQDGSKSDAIE
jgi:hypothetical protein